MTITDLVFVHGTGVRPERLAELLDDAKAGLVKVAPSIKMHQCYWADVGGETRLLGDGASVPGYGDTGGGEVEPNEPWTVLLGDPLHELRVLAVTHVPSGSGAELTIWLRDSDLAASGAALESLAGGLSHVELISAVLHSSEFQRLAQTVSELPAYDQQRAIARSVVALALLEREKQSMSTPHGTAVETVLNLAYGDLGCAVRGRLGDFVKDQTVGRAAQVFVGRRRGSRTDGSVGFVGDILRYQGFGEHPSGKSR